MSDAKVKVTAEALRVELKRAVKLDHLNLLVDQMIELILTKNADYGDAWQRYGIFTPLVRINDKILRVANLADGKPALVAGENVRDTLRDILCYALLGLLWLDAEEGFELEQLVQDVADAILHENDEPIDEKEFALTHTGSSFILRFRKNYPNLEAALRAWEKYNDVPDGGSGPAHELGTSLPDSAWELDDAGKLWSRS